MFEIGDLVEYVVHRGENPTKGREIGFITDRSPGNRWRLNVYRIKWVNYQTADIAWYVESQLKLLASGKTMDDE
jgi:hypothetical protein